ncbi:hypothetical protein HDC29_003429 [Sphingopyxis sp. JAI108]|nr:hypothetical protein [Sphingopyxis sp. JAI108]
MFRVQLASPRTVRLFNGAIGFRVGDTIADEPAQSAAIARRLPLLDRQRDVDAWPRNIISKRNRNIASLTWDYLWP